ncbi:MAG: cytochrome C [Pseudonocardiales bacterium]|nr:MAG: cytochrome C [Pseudonocardiales bacterium]
MDSVTSTSPAPRRPRGRWRRTKLGRRLAAALALGGALVTTGGLYVVLAPRPQIAAASATTAQVDPALVATGQQLYDSACITCHGTNLQGVAGRGPSLIGVGSAAVFFQVSTGRMPLSRELTHAYRKPPLPEFDPGTDQGRRNTAALEAYVQAHGGGPQLPAQRGSALRGDDPARGGELFRLNCASCHSFTGRGGALTSGTFAPILNPATPEQVYAAMLTGPANMPRFGDRQLTPQEKKDIIAYILSVSSQRNSPGGYDLGDIGPTAEGITAFVIGMVALVGVTVWLGAKS